MSSKTGHFTKLEKICVFLIAMGEDRAREILSDMDINTILKINKTMVSIGILSPQQKASVMIEFGDFFYKGKPLLSKSKSEKNRSESSSREKKPGDNKQNQNSLKKLSREKFSGSISNEEDERVVSQALLSLKAYAPKINWRKAGYDFGEGFRNGTGSEAE